MRILTILLGLVCFSASSQFEIGHTTITFQDPERNNRNIQTEIYYPANTSGDDVEAANGEFPVIVFGHGFVMVWSAYANIWEHLVPRGYIMAFPRTEGNIFPNHQAFGQDLAFLAGAMQVEEAVPNGIFTGHVATDAAIMGHSMGGGCSILAGESVDVNTIIGLAPAETNTSAIGAAANVTEPVLVLSGNADGVTPPEDHHIPIYDAVSSECKLFADIEEGSHCYFANSNFNCDFGEFNPGSLSRSQQHFIQFSLLDGWLDYHLKNECSGYDQVIDFAANDNRVNLSGSCPEVEFSCADPNCAADFNQDGVVNSGDLTSLLTEFNCVSNCNTDLSGDDLINSNDLAVFLVAFGVVCP